MEAGQDSQAWLDEYGAVSERAEATERADASTHISSRDSADIPVLIATPLEAEHVARIGAVDRRLAVLYEADLLPPAQYPSDHVGSPDFRRNSAQEKRWRRMLARAEIAYGIPGDSSEGLAALIRAAPRLRWVQGMAAGTGQIVAEARLLPDERARVTITSARGVHGGPLAEFAMLGVLAFTKDLPRLLDDKRERRWAHYPVDELSGKTLLLLGLGTIGLTIARAADAFGMRVLAVTRSGETASPYVAAAESPASLDRLLGQADVIVATLPLTDETRGLLSAEALQHVREGAIFVNVGRGAVVDEAALVAALQEGRLAGAALDVFATEPLPPDSPLWSMPNVLISPHTAALSIHENERIVDLFIENLRRHLAGERLLNIVDASRPY